MESQRVREFVQNDIFQDSGTQPADIGRVDLDNRHHRQ